MVVGLVISVALGAHTMSGLGCPMTGLAWPRHVSIVVAMQAVPPMVMVTFNALVEEEATRLAMTTSFLLNCPVVSALKEDVVVPALVFHPRHPILMAQGFQPLGEIALVAEPHHLLLEVQFFQIHV